MAKVLYFDVETSPNIVYSWQIGNKISLSHDNIIEERQIICICYKWEHENKVYSLDWGRKNDKQMLKKFVKIAHEADILVAHNGDKYDIRFIQGRLAYHDLPPLDTTTIDTLKLSRRAFYINSHRLDYLGQFFELGRKVDTGGFKLWKDVMSGSEKAMSKMIRYCKQDVRLLEDVYKKIRKYAPHAVHRGAINGNKDACPACESKSVTNWGSRVKTKIKYQRKRCSDCGHVWLGERV